VVTWTMEFPGQAVSLCRCLQAFQFFGSFLNAQIQGVHMLDGNVLHLSHPKVYPDAFV
jgi:hypothetical protein